jgi:methyltransferase
VFIILISMLALQRVAELVLSARNRRRLLCQGAVEYGRDHYPLMVVMHVLFYVSLVLEYSLLSNGWNPIWPLWLLLLVLAEILRIWVLAALGRSWSTRILVMPGADLVKSGPYRYIRHPNYLVVMVELFAVPVLCGCYLTALVFSVANALVLRIRIREEEQALLRAAGAGLNRLPRFIPRWEERT